jgi:excisionase family DNA binding protein
MLMDGWAVRKVRAHNTEGNAMQKNGKQIVEHHDKRSSEILTVKDAARLLSCHQSTLYRLCNAGEIPAFRLGGGWRFLRESLEGWMLRGGTLS